jgi:preprotein translocase subunit Sec63
MLGAADSGQVVAFLQGELTRTAGADMHVILGVARGAERCEVRAAYLRLARTFHPNRFARFGEDEAAMAMEIFIRIGKAYRRCLNARPIHKPKPVARHPMPRRVSSR